MVLSWPGWEAAPPGGESGRAADGAETAADGSGGPGGAADGGHRAPQHQPQQLQAEVPAGQQPRRASGGHGGQPAGAHHAERQPGMDLNQIYVGLGLSQISV